MKTSPGSKLLHEATTPKRVVIADRHVCLRNLIRPLLEGTLGCEIIGETRSGAEALLLCREKRPDVLILELDLDELGGAELLGLLRRELPDLRTLVFTGSENRELIRNALRARPMACVHKQFSLPSFQAALQTILRGSAYFCAFSTEIAQRLDEPALGDNLNEIERAVLKLIAEGKQNKEISDLLKRPLKTVEHDRANLMKKLGQHDVAGLTRVAIQLGLVAAR